MELTRIKGGFTIPVGSPYSSNSASLSLSTGTTAMDQWSYPTFIEAKEVGESVEFIYKQDKLITYTPPNFNNPQETRVFKIVYSCKEGKWHKSDPIYGDIIPARDESYSFED